MFIPISMLIDLATFATPPCLFQHPRLVKKIWWITKYFGGSDPMNELQLKKSGFNIQNSDLAEKMPYEYKIKGKDVIY